MGPARQRGRQGGGAWTAWADGLAGVVFATTSSGRVRDGDARGERKEHNGSQPNVCNEWQWWVITHQLHEEV